MGPAAFIFKVKYETVWEMHTYIGDRGKWVMDIRRII
jgi:hypothetical protein